VTLGRVLPLLLSLAYVSTVLALNEAPWAWALTDVMGIVRLMEAGGVLRGIPFTLHPLPPQLMCLNVLTHLPHPIRLRDSLLPAAAFAVYDATMVWIIPAILGRQVSINTLPVFVYFRPEPAPDVPGVPDSSSGGTDPSPWAFASATPLEGAEGAVWPPVVANSDCECRQDWLRPPTAPEDLTRACYAPPPILRGAPAMPFALTLPLLGPTGGATVCGLGDLGLPAWLLLAVRAPGAVPIACARVLPHASLFHDLAGGAPHRHVSQRHKAEVR
jgi:hypothetical protein